MYRCVLQRIKEFESVLKPNSQKKAEGSTIGEFKVYQRFFSLLEYLNTL